MNFKFSLIFCIYYLDNPKYLEICFRGILRNTLLPSEIIVVKDGPISIELNEIIKKFQHKYPSLIRVFNLEKNVGSAVASNYAISKTSYEWIVKQDADDFSFKERFSTLMKHTSNEPSFFGSYMYETYEKKKILKKNPLNSEKIRKMIPYRNPFSNPTMCFHKALFRNLGGYPQIKFKEDWAFWIVSFNQFNCHNINIPLVRSINSDSMIIRRKGIHNIKSEFLIQKLLIKNKLNTLIKAISIFFIRILLLNLPISFIDILYKKYLRDDAKFFHKFF